MYPTGEEGSAGEHAAADAADERHAPHLPGPTGVAADERPHEQRLSGHGHRVRKVTREGPVSQGKEVEVCPRRGFEQGERL